MGLTSKCSDVVSILKQITVEPYVLFFVFGYTIRLVTFQDLLLQKSCELVLQYPKDVCGDPEKYKKEHNEAQTMGTNLYVAQVMVSTFPSLVVATFVGPWSDKYGRRIPLICACTGTLIDGIITTIISSNPTVLPYYYLIPAFIGGMSGGFITTMSSCYSYVSDITDESTRQSRFAIFEFFYIMATPLGTVIGGVLFKLGEYTAVFSAAPISFGLALAWAVLMLKEPRQRQSKATGKEMIKDLFQLGNLKEIRKTSTVKRPGNIRLQIWLLIFAGCCIRLIEMGSLAIGYNYAKKMYLWNIPTFSNAITIFQVCNALTTLTVVPMLSRSLFLHEGAVGLIGIFSLMAKMILLSVAEEEWLFFFGWFAGLVQSCARIAVRSRLSKLVSKKEQGRVFSLLATCEALTPVLGMIMFSQIFNASLNVYPGIAYAVGAVTLLPTAAIFGWLMKMPTTSFTELEETQEDTRTKEMQEVASGSMEKQ